MTTETTQVPAKSTQIQRKVGYKSPPINIDAQFKPGQSGWPGGKPTKSRNRLQGEFLRELADDFELHGKKAIQAMRQEKPAEYIKVVASLMPKQLEEVATDPLDGISDERLEEMIAVLDRMVEGQKLNVVDVTAKVPVDARSVQLLA